MDNNASNNNWNGISISSSCNNSFTGNTACSNNKSGIFFDVSNNNTIIDNTASNSELFGIFLIHSSSNMLRKNLLYGNRYNFGADGESGSDLDNEIDTSNLVDGRPIYYLLGASGTIIDSSSNAGTVYCINCDRIKVKDLVITNNYAGIAFYNTSNSSIENNNISNNLASIALGESSNNTIVGNKASNNFLGFVLSDYSNSSAIIGNNVSNSELFGIFLQNTTGNCIYLNNFINNTNNVHSDNSTNFWNSPLEITHTHNRTTYESYLGNYWSDYEEKYPDAEEIDTTGIWDTPYSIDGDKDYYPLMEKFEHYFQQ